MDSYDVLIVEDDASLREALSDTLELAGFSTSVAGDGLEALASLASRRARLVISDVQMRNMDGIGLLEQIRARYAELPVLLMTAYGTVEKAVAAMKAGAVDYLVKPFPAEALVERAARHIGPRVGETVERVVEAPVMKKLFGLAARVAHCEATVLILGESGVGKEVLARYIHRNSPRHAGPFVAINCAAIPENLLEAELFGYEKGAYTGALRSSPGRLEMAQGGTLLLDEIAEMALPLQAKLLRVLQERELERVGGRKTIRLDTRILATANRCLKTQVARGEFREDLYYRLSVFPLRIPPLRERREDIAPMAKALLQRHWKSGKPAPAITPEALATLQNYAWPGNVRELDNVMQRALILHAGDEIRTDDLVFEDGFGVCVETATETPFADEARNAADSLGDGLRSAEEKIIMEALKETNGGRKAAADKLGISQRTLRYKIARMREAGLLA